MTERMTPLQIIFECFYKISWDALLLMKYDSNLHFLNFLFCFSNEQLSQSDSLWNCFLDMKNFRMELWEKIVPNFKYNPEIPFFEMLVPTTDTVRYGYLMDKLLAIKKPVLFTGTTGVGKV